MSRPGGRRAAGQGGNPLLEDRSPCGTPRDRQSGRIAQLVEQLTLNQRVVGSNPTAPTIYPDISKGYDGIEIWFDFGKSYKQV